jgi:microsomal dipeptidase-like Zn-dependent dipeptidase
MQRAIAKEAEAIREKRVRIIKADGELEAANKLNEGAAIIASHSSALELRRLQAPRNLRDHRLVARQK